MLYPLLQLHQLIDKLTQSVQATAVETSGDCLPLIKKAIAEAQAFPLSFMQQAAGAKNSKALQVLVHTCQVGCTSLLDRLNVYINTLKIENPASSTNLLSGYNELETHLLNGILYFQQHFTHYFDKEQQLPVVYKLQEQKKLEQLLQALTVQWANSTIHPELQAIALAPLQQFINVQTTRSYSFQQLNYLRSLMSALAAIGIERTGESVNRDLIDTLIRLNFNDVTLLQYIMQYLYRHISNTALPHDQASQWALHEKHFGQAYTGELALLSGSPSAKETLVSMIQQEIKYLNQQQSALAAIYGSQPATSAHTKNAVLTTLSVGQIAVLTRLLVDSKIIDHSNQTELLKMIAGALKTTRATHISADSLRSKFYSPDAASINIIKEHLHQMITHLRKY